MTRARAPSGRRGRLPSRRAERPRARRPSSGTCAAARSARTSWSACARPPTRCRARCEQFEPPARLKASLMEVVEREARADGGSGAEARAARLRFRDAARVRGGRARCSGSWSASAWRSSAETRRRTVAATADKAMPRAGGNARHRGRHGHPAAARHAGTSWPRASTRCGCNTATSWFPRARSRSERAGPAACSCAGSDDANGVYVTREPRGGAQVPSEDPILSVPL